MPDELLLTPEKITEIIEGWHKTVEPYLVGLNSTEAEEKLKELPDVYEMLLEAQLAKVLKHRLDRPDREKWKDTVMNEKQIALAINHTLEEDQVDFMQYVRGVTEKEKEVAETQAEITWNKLLALIPTEEEIKKQERVEIGKYLEHCYLSPYETHRLISIHDIERLKRGQALKDG